MYTVAYTLVMASEVRFSLVKGMLEKKGYELARINGSHHIFTKKGHSLISIPVHNNKVKPKYINDIKKL